jgi:hypothetical protein
MRIEQNLKIETIQEVIRLLKSGKKVQLEYQPAKRTLKVLTVTSKKVEEVEL